MNARATLDLTPLQGRLGYQFKKPELLNQALTHRSHSKKNNERLEFLGDSVLNCVVAEILYERYSDLDEGDLSRVRANLVKQQALYEIAQALLLSDYLKLGEVIFSDDTDLQGLYAMTPSESEKIIEFLKTLDDYHVLSNPNYAEPR